MIKNVCIVLFVLLTGLSACKKEEAPVTNDAIAGTLDPPSATKEILEFKFEAKHNAQQLLKDVVCHINGNHIVGCVPYLTNNKSLVATFTINGIAITVNGETQQNSITLNDYSRPVTFTVRAADSTTKAYKVSLHTFTGLPVLYLETEAPVVSKDDYVKGKVIIDANSKYDQPVT